MSNVTTSGKSKAPLINNGKLLDLSQYEIKTNADNPEFWARLIYSKVTGLNDHGDRRFGLYSFLAETTRHIICYNHPALKSICQTAFTDGEYIYFDADFLMALARDHVENNTEDMYFVILHELSHMLSDHVPNYKSFLEEFPETTNIALDMRINIDLYQDFIATGIIKGPGSFLSKFIGMDDVEASIKKYGDKAEILILEDMLKNTKEQPRSELNQKPFSMDDIENACKRAGLDKTWDKIKKDLEEVSEPPKSSPSSSQDSSNDQQDPNSQSGQGEQQDPNSESGQGGQQDPNSLSGQGEQQDPNSLSGQGEQQDPNSESGQGGQQDPNSQSGRSGQQDQSNSDGQPSHGGYGSHRVSMNDLIDSLNNNGQSKSTQKLLEELGVNFQKGDPSRGGQSGPGTPGAGDGDSNHMITQEELSKIFEESGLESVKKVLDIPDSDDVKAHNKKKEARKNINEGVIKSAMDESAKAEQAGRKAAGSQSMLTARKRLEIEKESKLTWRIMAEEVISGENGNEMDKSDRALHSMYYFEPSSLGLNTGSRLVEQGNVMVKREGVVIVLIDTSASVSKGELRQFLSEIKNIIKDQDEESCNTVVLMDIDTQIADDYLILNDEDIDDWLENASAHDGGGTNLQNGIIESLNNYYDNENLRYHPKIMNRELAGLIMMTDLGDSTPNIDVIREEVLFGREEDPKAKIPPTIFITTKENYISYGKNFSQGLETWAGLFPITDKVTIDLEEIKEIQRENRVNEVSRGQKDHGLKPKSGPSVF